MGPVERWSRGGSVVRRWIRRRFPFLFFPLAPYRETVDASPPNDGLDGHLSKADYSLRLQRYWWAGCVLSREASATDRVFVVVDLGCERGWLKRFTRPNPRIRWIGLDGDTSKPSLVASEYDEVICCHFSEPLPLPDGCADAVVSLHVFEHLHDAELAAAEVARVLKPGGVFLAGTPGAPSPLAALRTVLLQKRHLAGKNRHWGHVRKFSPSSWCRLCDSVGLGLEFITGSHLMRRTGASIENRRWWIRANQAWGGLFPSLGSELYLCARKPLQAQPVAAGPNWLERLWFRADWAAPVAAALVLTLGLFALPGRLGATMDQSFSDEIASLQDGNDVFVWGVESRPISRHTARLVDRSAGRADMESLLDSLTVQNKDMHLIIDDDRIGDYLDSPIADSIRISAEWRAHGDLFLVLTNESEGSTLLEYMRTKNTRIR